MENKIIYMDDDNNIVDESVATKTAIVEYDSEGNVVNEVFGYANFVPKEVDNDAISFSKEEYEELKKMGFDVDDYNLKVR